MNKHITDLENRMPSKISQPPSMQFFIQTFIPEGVDPRTDFEFGQRLLAVITTPGRLFGTNVKRIGLDEEIVPAWAAIQRNTLGSSEWKSKFGKYGSFGGGGRGKPCPLENADLDAIRRDFGHHIALSQFFSVYGPAMGGGAEPKNQGTPKMKR